jgi:hypothetical protein
MEGFLCLDHDDQQRSRLAGPPLLCVAGIGGDLAALETILDAVADIKLAGIVSAGNHCLGGPQPYEVWQRLRALGATMVRGPTDVALGGIARIDALPSHLDGNLVSALTHAQEALGDIVCRRLLDLPTTTVVSLPDLRGVMVAHGSPADETMPLRNDDSLAVVVDCVAEDVFVCGGSTLLRGDRPASFARRVRRATGGPLLVAQVGGTVCPSPLGAEGQMARSARAVLLGCCDDNHIRAFYRDLPVKSSRLRRVG